MVWVFPVGSHVFKDILLSRCVTKFSFMFVLKTLVNTRIMIKVLKAIFLSTNIDENKERTNCQCPKCHRATMIVIVLVMTSST
jgi:hypothetical protein